MPYRVYWEDTDAGGVVYHARYLHFFERARSDWLLALGYPQVKLRNEANRLFAVSRMDTRFLSPARLEDELEVSVVVEQLRAASVIFSQAMHRVGDGELLATAEVRAVCLAADSFRPARAPADLFATIKRYQQEQDS
ncbi:YbgC/FadM family acyl-CoA thioesterase [Wenzhouxiangella marina]|uniref:Putative thioesterase protein n=1 Tax=Wenzhouxiangella marina TaxID=1579979 RepID=A0A0K0XTE7_9GAMM|nr:YbgC/FadM family acyl-CoA thioesterase [Wenzhouxiangella marina]AKS40897.1 putative thioesterase protein [Wenzhouxiangella marina]MBB6087771.1 acyl-CoA thioester hydrolase [Wenzhouxiangella marina]